VVYDAKTIRMNDVCKHGRTYHRSNPLASVNISVPNNGRLSSRAAGTEDVDALDGTTSNRCSTGDELGVVGEGGDKIGEELQMVSIRVVCVEPSIVGETS
jgi:hypothetical protein